MENIWTVQKEVLGTAHMSRNAEIVDFRPATILVEGGKIVVAPAKGVQIEKLNLDPDEIDRVEEERDTPFNGAVAFKQEFRKTFMGVLITVRSCQRWEWYNDAAREAMNQQEVASEKKFLKQREICKDFLNALSFEKIADEVTRRELGRLKSGRRSINHVIDRIFRKLLTEEFPGILLEGSLSQLRYDAVKKVAPVFKEFLLKRDLLERERRKAEWMSR